MIDTDKYEGHTEGPWVVCCEDQKSPHPPRWIQADEKSVCSHMEDVTETDIQLMADAPLLLAEVKRLRSLIDMVLKEVKYLQNYQDIVEEYDGCFAPEDHTTQWQMLMEAHRIEEEQEE